MITPPESAEVAAHADRPDKMVDLMERFSPHPARSPKPAVVSATAALAALSVALLLTMPAVTATGQSLRATQESEATRAALAQLRESLNEAARALAGVERSEGQPAAADRHTLRETLAERPTVRPEHAEPDLDSELLRGLATLLNLPPPTR
ncbi:MAG: hypothetical protein AAF328_04970 [Planctomycetota bacterium]